MIVDSAPYKLYIQFSFIQAFLKGGPLTFEFPLYFFFINYMSISFKSFNKKGRLCYQIIR